MDCVQSVMLSVPPVGEAAVQQPLSAAYSPSDSDQAQFEADKRAVYKYVLLNDVFQPLIVLNILGIHYSHFWLYYLKDVN